MFCLLCELRRDLHGKVTRVMARKLSHIDPTMLMSMVSKTDRLTAREFVSLGIRKHSDRNGRISTDFWILFYEEYDLEQHPDLVLGSDDEAGDGDPSLYDRELLECISLARKKNPAERRPEPLCDYLERCLFCIALYCPALLCMALFALRCFSALLCLLGIALCCSYCSALLCLFLLVFVA